MTHNCPHCGKRFSSLWDLQIHERIHKGEKPYRCPEGKKSFPTKGKLARHQEVAHKLQFSFSCPEAEVQLVSEQESNPVKGTEQNHLAVPSGEKPYRCPECEKSFYTKGKLVRHQEVTHKLEFSLLFHKVKVQLVSEQDSHPLEGTDQNHLTAPPLSGASRGIISQQLENEEVHGRFQERDIVIKLNPTRKDAPLRNQLVSETTSQGREASGSQLEREIVTSFNPKRKDALLDHQVLSAVTSRVGEISDRHGGMHRQSSDHLQKQPVQKTKKTSIPLLDQVVSQPTTLANQSFTGTTSDGREAVERSCDENMIQSTDCLQGNSAGAEKKTYRCPQCGKSLCSSFSLSRHIETHSCSVCKKSFSCKSKLSEHQKSHKEDKLHQCTECGKTFDFRSQLLMHETTHTGEKPYTCPDCGKHFRINVHLLSHQKCHKEEKQYQCVECEESFKSKWSLVQHRRIHTGEKPYKCLKCERTFRHPETLAVHTRSHTGEKPYKCPHCETSFSSKPNLLRHIKSHTGEKPHKCLVCGKCFSSKSSLVRHGISHMRKKQHKCSECEETFSSNSSLLVHKQSHMPE